MLHFSLLVLQCYEFLPQKAPVLCFLSQPLIRLIGPHINMLLYARTGFLFSFFFIQQIVMVCGWERGVITLFFCAPIML